MNSAAIEAIAKNDGIVVLLVGIRLSGEKIEPRLPGQRGGGCVSQDPRSFHCAGQPRLGGVPALPGGVVDHRASLEHTEGILSIHISIAVINRSLVLIAEGQGGKQRGELIPIG